MLCHAILSYPMQHPPFPFMSNLDMHQRVQLHALIPMLAILLELPSQKLPIEFTRAPKETMLESAIVHERVTTVRRHTARVRHAGAEDAAAEARV
jgi:hypothetical protein